MRSYSGHQSFESHIHAFIASKKNDCDNFLTSHSAFTINGLRCISNYVIRQIFLIFYRCLYSKMSRRVLSSFVFDWINFNILFMTLKMLGISELFSMLILLKLKCNKFANIKHVFNLINELLTTSLKFFIFTLLIRTTHHYRL